jgi:ribonuclease BN (tRNA processing enzyme)
MTPPAAQSVQVQFLGSGDAFGSGGRFQTCIAVTAGPHRVLIDCGASSMIALKRFGIDPNSIEAILITHLHGDHFGGLPFFILDSQLHAKRTRPLLIGGPPGTPERLAAAMEALFPNSSKAQRKFEISHLEWTPRQRIEVGPAAVTPFPVVHGSGAPPFALRVELGGRIVAYSGDTEWAPALPDAARDADLFICECLMFDKPVKFHLDYETLRAHADELRPKRLLLTHLGPEMLAQRPNLVWETSEDGKVVEL